MRSSSSSSTMQKLVETIYIRIWISLVLLVLLSILYAAALSIYSVLWIGEPIEVACQNVDSIQIDCSLTYRALLRSSKQEIKAVQGMNINERISSSGSENNTEYVALLSSQSGDYPIKTYSKHNDPELEILNHRFNKFIKNSQETLIIPVCYNRWQPIVSFFTVLGSELETLWLRF